MNEVTKALLSAPKLQFHFQIFQACCKGYTDIYICVYTRIYNIYIVYIYILVGGLEHLLFSIIYGIILPIDELIFFRRVAQPPTSINRWLMDGMMYG